MRKKTVLALVCILIFAVSALSLAGCEKKSFKIVFLGDSIGEGIAGPTPVQERENYGYYGILGQRNNCEYINRAVSGATTETFLSYLKKTDKETDIKMLHTHLKTADVVHISIIGNDFLFENVGGMAVQVSQNNFTKVDGICDNAYANISQAVKLLKELNPDVTIFIQRLYNPIFPGSTLIGEPYTSILKADGYDDEGLRELGTIMLNRLNGVFQRYLDENPGAFHLLDVQGAFQAVYEADAAKATSLMSVDWVHPSSRGHALIADGIQKKLEELGFADEKSAVKLYSKNKLDQLDRLYKDYDMKDAVKKIKKAKSCEEISNIYFDAISGKTPAL